MANEGNNDIIDSDADWNLGRTASFQARTEREQSFHRLAMMMVDLLIEGGRWLRA
jgi:hypothetical protein